MEVFSPNGEIDRELVTRVVKDDPAPETKVAQAEVVPIEVNGDSADHYDLVFVGDGYTADQLETYGEHARSKYEDVMSIEPFKSNRERFNAWQVNVVSNESGVDNDPDQGVQRDTALDMEFWCGGTERLLCVNTEKAGQYAAAADDVDQIMAVANSTKYGGAGYSGLATVSGGNESSGQVAIHEFGHSIGGLADEYDYGGDGEVYTGPEPSEPNVSIHTAAEMEQNQTKWYQYLGQETSDGGLIDTFEGGYYYPRGIYRPSENSIMRELGREFNSVGLDVMTAAFQEEPQ